LIGLLEKDEMNGLEPSMAAQLRVAGITSIRHALGYTKADIARMCHVPADEAGNILLHAALSEFPLFAQPCTTLQRCGDIEGRRKCVFYSI